MAKGIYSSGMSAWERNKRGLPADHAGPETIGEEKVDVKPEKVEKEAKVSPEEKKVEVSNKEAKGNKKSGKNSDKK